MYKPYLTEKSVSANSKGKYIFNISINDNRNTVKKNIEKIFNVKVKNVNILIKKGKSKRFKGIFGFRNDIKKAIIQLEKNYKIAGFETEESDTKK